MRRGRSPAALALSSAGTLAAIAVSIPLGRYASTPALWALVAIPVVFFVASRRWRVTQTAAATAPRPEVRAVAQRLDADERARPSTSLRAAGTRLR
jgi:hypothetical protein